MGQPVRRDLVTATTLVYFRPRKLQDSSHMMNAFRLAPVRTLAAAALLGLVIAAAVPSKAARTEGPTLTIAVIGDYGDCAYHCVHEQAVADMVHGWKPDAIWTVGDNSYENATAAEVTRDQGPYALDVKAGVFYQVTGNHDWANSCDPAAIQASTAYFGRPPHYVGHFGGGLLDLFALDMNCGDPGGDSARSPQAAEYRAAVAASSAVWKIAADHQPFYSSGEHGTAAYTHWAILPAIDLFLSGHDHDWEHLILGGKNYVVDGVGGKNVRPMCLLGCTPGSVWHDDSHFGAVRLTVTPTSLKVDYVAVGEAVLHSFSLSKTAPVAVSPPIQAPASDPNLPIRAAFYYPSFPEAWTQSGTYPDTKYHPSLGFYASADPSVVKKQIAALRYGNIKAGIVSWAGPGAPTDDRIPVLLAAAAGTPFRWALYYEAEARGDPTPTQIRADLEYIRSRYATNPAYLRVAGAFVVFVFADTNDGCDMAARWKQANTVGAFIVLKEFPSFRQCAAQPDGWHQYSPAVAEAPVSGNSFTISPGFEKLGEPAARLSRDVSRWSANIVDMIGSNAPFQLVTTFNDWGEGSAVESAREWSSSSGYGAYLDALHNNGQEPPGATQTVSLLTPERIALLEAGLAVLSILLVTLFFDLRRRRQRR